MEKADTSRGQKKRPTARRRKKKGKQDTMGGQEFELREQDRWLPIANVARLMKNTLPGTAKVSKDAKECMQECVSEFISFVTSEASDRCVMEKRKTINGEDVLYSLHTLGFENYAEVLKIYLAKYRQQQALKQERGEVKSKKKKKRTEDGEGEEAQEVPGEEPGGRWHETGGRAAEEYAEDSPEAGARVQDMAGAGLDGRLDALCQRPMDESQALRSVDTKQAAPFTEADAKKKEYEEEYVSQLYEQSYANVPLHMANPDYHGGAASKSILLNEDGGGGETDRDAARDGGLGHGGIEDDVDNSMSLEIGVGVNVHLGNTESLDAINSRLNKTTNNGLAHGSGGKNNTSENAAAAGGAGGRATPATAVAGLAGDENTSNMRNKDTESLAARESRRPEDDGSNGGGCGKSGFPPQSFLGSSGETVAGAVGNGQTKHKAGEEVPSKTPATTTTSDLLLLNDNIEGISEREEIVGLTNGHSGMYSFE